MRTKWISSVAILCFLLFLSGCSESQYDYTSSFENVGEKSVSGIERDRSLSNRSLEGQIDFYSKLVPVKMTIIPIDENLKETKSVEGEIKEDGGVYLFSTAKVNYPTSLIKIRYTCKSKDSTQDFKMDLSHYANIANNSSPEISFAAAIKNHRIASLIEDDVFSFNIANLKATRELYHILRLDSVTKILKSPDSLTSKTLNWYVETMSYFYLGGHLDSTFLNRFEHLSLALENESSWWSFVSEVEIADSIVQNFRNRFFHIDTSLKVFADFWSKAYKLPVCDSSNFLDTIKNPAKSSIFFDDVFICNKGDSKSDFYYWHPLNETEKIIGLCPLQQECVKEYNGVLYVSSKSDLEWRLGNAKEVLIHVYGECNQEKWNQVRIVHDTMFLCKKNSDWTKDFDTLSINHNALVEAYALNKYGECTDTNNLAKGDIDAFNFVQCINKKWTNIGEEYYFGDSCTESRSGELLRTPRATYYMCRYYWNKYTWVSLLAPEYYGDICDADSKKTIVNYDNKYFKCDYGPTRSSGGWVVLNAEDVLPPISNKDTCLEKRILKYNDVYYICRDKEWFALSKEEAIPPVIDERPCGSHEDNTFVKYGEDYYTCKDHNWSFVEKKDVPLPEIHGDSCDSRYWGHMVEYNNEYFICSRNDYSSSQMGYWSKPDKAPATVYEYNKTRGSECAAGQVGTTLEWNSKIGALMGCVMNAATNVYEWGIVLLNFPMSISEQKIVGGEFKTDDTYEIIVDGITYEFSGFRLSRASDEWNNNLWAHINNHHVVIDGNRYEAEWVDSNLYINKIRGETSISLADIEPKSSSYNDFYETWFKWVDQSNTCKGGASGFHFPITSIQVNEYGEDLFDDWNTAKSFCPKGFHIPDTTEWKKSNINTHANAIAPVVETYEPERRCNIKKYSKGFVLLWSSTEKDSITQYCLGYTTTQDYGESRKNFLECPKDLFPLAQVVCVKDKQ